VLVFFFVVNVIDVPGGGIGCVSLSIADWNFRDFRVLFFVVVSGNDAAANVTVDCHVFPPG
jgi:hypothetical protein